MRLRFLGTGTSFGIPVIGCECATCTSADPRDHRTRHAVLLEGEIGGEPRRILVDTPPELRLQLVRERIRWVDAVWFTHCHADHVHGVDDLRAFTVRQRHSLQAFAGPDCAEVLRSRFSYIFDDAYRPPQGTTKPEVRLATIQDGEEMDVAGFRMLPLPVPHGPVTVYGFRVGALGYITDAATLPPAVRAALRGVRVLVLNALWFGKRHPTHLTVEEAVELAREIGAEHTYLTHLTHRVRHADLLDTLPPGIQPAYDGLAVEI